MQIAGTFCWDVGRLRSSAEFLKQTLVKATAGMFEIPYLTPNIQRWPDLAGQAEHAGPSHKTCWRISSWVICVLPHWILQRAWVAGASWELHMWAKITCLCSVWGKLFHWSQETWISANTDELGLSDIRTTLWRWMPAFPSSWFLEVLT